MNNIELRDYFAAAALTGLVANEGVPGPKEEEDFAIADDENRYEQYRANDAERCYRMANAMLAERAKQGGELVALNIPNTEAVQEQ